MEVQKPTRMDGFIQHCVSFYREKLNELLLEEPQTFEDLHILVDKLLELQQEFEEVVKFVEDISSWNFDFMIAN